jgi:hypothetical protein
MTKKQNEGWDDISKEDSSCKPITAWAVEIDGSLGDHIAVIPTRAMARQVRNQLIKYDPVITKATVRKVVLQVVPGR